MFSNVAYTFVDIWHGFCSFVVLLTPGYPWGTPRVGTPHYPRSTPRSTLGAPRSAGNLEATSARQPWHDDYGALATVEQPWRTSIQYAGGSRGNPSGDPPRGGGGGGPPRGSSPRESPRGVPGVHRGSDSSSIFDGGD